MMARDTKVAFVTGATGLLGNNLVRALLAEGVQVRGLARSAEKARQQFGALDGLEIVQGDMEDVPGFAAALAGCDTLFHTAAYFRDSYYGGRHWDKLKAINVDATGQLMAAAHGAGIRQIVHTSSIAVVDGGKGQLVDESMKRPAEGADDYYRSKILSDRVVMAHLDRHPDCFGVFVMPGWMHGPGDRGPTAAGQFTLDFMRGKLPGIPPATFAFVDARDVAQAEILALRHGGRGEHYLAAGRHVTMAELMRLYERTTGIAAPGRGIPAAALWLIAGVQEAVARLTGRPALLSLAAVRNMRREFDRSRFDPAKSREVLGLSFRPMEETIAAEVAWYRDNGMLPAAPGRPGAAHLA